MYTKREWVIGVTIDERGWPNYRLRDMQDPHDPQEYRANAHLIAAAPDMYEALKGIVVQFAGLLNPTDRECIRRAEQALSKAVPTT